MTHFIRFSAVALSVIALHSCGDSLSSKDPIEKEIMSNKNDFAGRPVVFYNVENLFDTKNDPRTDDEDFTPYGYKSWDEERYETKLERIEEAIGLIGKPPVLIGLVEVENREVLEDLIDEGKLEDVDYGIVQYDSPDRRGIDCALLYDEDVFKLKQSTKYPVTLPDNPNYLTRDILYVEGEIGGAEMHVFVNHWSSRREGKRETEHKRIAAAKVLREKVDIILKNDPDANILILGDFNDHPSDKSLETILRAKESGFASEGDLINLLYDEHELGEGTAVHEREWGVIDQIIVSQGLYDGTEGVGIEGRDAEILRRNELLYTYSDSGQKPNSTYGGRKYYGGYSDHLPVYIILK